ncbi:MAG: hypothetical protein AAF224_06730 [Pseudomonadota bacterium]
MKKSTIGLIAGVFAGCALAIGGANAAENDRVTGYDLDNLERILAPDHASVERNTVNGRTALIVRGGNGGVAVLIPNMCDRDGRACKGLYMQSYFGEQPSVAAINTFNQSAFVAAAVKDPNGKARLFRYLIADFGYIEGSLRVDMFNFFTAGKNFYETVLSGGRTANTISYEAAGDTSGDAPSKTSATPQAHETPSAPLFAASPELLKAVSMTEIDESLYSRPGSVMDSADSKVAQ